MPGRKRGAGMSIQTKAIALLEAQQRELEEQMRSGKNSARGTSSGQRPDDRAGSARAAWMVGEQLKDICRMEPRSAELIAQDLENKDMSITAAEKKIKAFADKNKTGNFSCVTPAEADRILREFYGLPEPAEGPTDPIANQPPVPSSRPEPEPPAYREIINLDDFL